MPPLFPNLYVFLVAPPGIGKGVAMDRTEEVWRSVEHIHMAPSSVSKASLMDALGEASRHVIRLSEIPPHVEYNSLQLLIRELGMFLPEYDRELLNALTDIYDGKPYLERKRTANMKLFIERPQLNLLAGCTPAYLMSTFPEAAWEHGFSSRTIMIYSGEVILSKDLFDTKASPEINRRIANLKHDIDLIASDQFYGEFRWQPEAMAAFMKWYSGNQEFSDVPKPSHPRLVAYLTRRWTHLAKLCMIASVSRSLDKWITRQDFGTAMEWLTEAEIFMEDIFKAMPVAGDARALEELYHFVFKLYMKNNRQPVGEHLLVRFLAERVPHHSVMRIIEMLERMDQLQRVSNTKDGRGLYKPIIREQ